MRYTANGSPVTTFSIATNRRYRTRDGEQREETEWFRVVTWNQLAETCNQYLTKGRRVYVEGRLKSDTWTGPGTGRRASPTRSTRLKSSSWTAGPWGPGTMATLPPSVRPGTRTTCPGRAALRRRIGDDIETSIQTKGTKPVLLAAQGVRLLCRQGQVRRLQEGRRLQEIPVGPLQDRGEAQDRCLRQAPEGPLHRHQAGQASRNGPLQPRQAGWRLCAVPIAGRLGVQEPSRIRSLDGGPPALLRPHGSA